ncbi:MAG: MaoC family dehydratase [Marinibacterium sp.]|nr:MaoC family dehydratase [Marinibacterium sp.]
MTQHNSPRDAALAQLTPTIGQLTGVSAWIEIDQPRIDRFADVTEDQQWIHVDPDRAATESPFGATIAHGFLSLSLASRFYMDVMQPLPGSTMGINYGFEKLRFLSPVTVGARLRGRFTLAEISARGDRDLLQAHDLVVEIEGSDTPALVARWLNIARF